MNSTLFTVPIPLVNNSVISTVVESWFIPLDIFAIICATLAIGLATLILSIIIFDKTCHSVPMLLIANSCLAELIFALNILVVSVFTLQNDIKQIGYQDSLCSIRGYFIYSLCALQNYSYLLQAIHRYVTVVYPTRLFWQSVRTQMLLIGVLWIFAFIYSAPFLFIGDIVYDVNNQICLLPLGLSFSIVFVTVCNYMFPVWMIRFIYFKLVRYVKKMNNHVISANTLCRAQRELKMTRRIIILVMILMIIGAPYGVFIMISYFTTPPKYYFRFSLIFMYTSVICVMIALFQFTDPFKNL